MAADEVDGDDHHLRLRMQKVFTAAFPSIPEGELDETIVVRGWSAVDSDRRLWHAGCDLVDLMDG